MVSGADVVATARTVLGDQYQWGGEDNPGFDCSGLCQWAYAQNGIQIPRTSQEQAAAGTPVAYSDLQPGDLIIFYPDASHVALYSGGGNIIQAADYGIPVEEVPIDQGGPLNQARRIITTQEPATMTANGIDYAGGRPSGADIKAAGYSFVCRYLSDGGSGLPGKLLVPSEVADLQANGIDIVSNWETTGTTALGGYSAGVSDAQAAWQMHTSLGGPTSRPIYFSLDWDEAPDQDAAVFAYFQGVASVIGLQNTGVYGGYWICKRLLDAGLVTYAWQTQAWSGGNQDPRINILQNNNAGYANIDGVQCDIDNALTDDYGQWSYQQPSTGGNPFMALTDQQQADLYNAVMAISALVFDTNTQLRGPNQQGWSQLGLNSSGQNLSVVDALAAIKNNTTPSTTPPKS